MRVVNAIFAALMAALCVLIALVCIETARADEPKGFDSVNEAAVIILASAYNKHPHYYEYGGVIVQAPTGKFAASQPVTIGRASSMDINEDPDAYDESLPIVADYHTHPCISGYVPGVFSPADLHNARELGRPSYILDECTGDVHYWKPGDGYDAPQSVMGFMSRAQLASGRVVGHIPVDGKEIKL